MERMPNLQTIPAGSLADLPLSVLFELALFDFFSLRRRNIHFCPLESIGEGAFPLSLRTLRISHSALTSANVNDWFSGSLADVTAVEELFD
jgi:hypothetical protein